MLSYIIQFEKDYSWSLLTSHSALSYLRSSTPLCMLFKSATILTIHILYSFRFLLESSTWHWIVHMSVPIIPTSISIIDNNPSYFFFYMYMYVEFGVFLDFHCMLMFGILFEYYFWWFIILLSTNFRIGFYLILINFNISRHIINSIKYIYFVLSVKTNIILNPSSYHWYKL